MLAEKFKAKYLHSLATFVKRKKQRTFATKLGKADDI